MKDLHNAHAGSEMYSMSDSKKNTKDHVQSSGTNGFCLGGFGCPMVFRDYQV